ncbi:hypothetical protein OESDEN_00547 [Oesophagostomum dentatum]|uniref:G-protein coupled receptors family 1 profile domain-containing protein n=1 Tax=Oesophagostomum dentatum TaxID=61180 RepID=A0A0B1TPI5_OESDE|nr:hypothetical protein OESDEN_00547 [Oesophagostomum dentatum]
MLCKFSGGSGPVRANGQRLLPYSSSTSTLRVFLANVAIADLVFAGATTFAQIRLIPNKWAFAYVPLGPAASFGSRILFIFSETDANFIREYLSINKPQYNLTDFVISGNHMIKSPLTSITLATIVLPMFPIYVLVIYFYKKVQGYLNVNTTIYKTTESA